MKTGLDTSLLVHVYLFVSRFSLTSMFPGFLKPIMAFYLILLVLGEYYVLFLFSHFNLNSVQGAKPGPNISNWTEHQPQSTSGFKEGVLN